MELQKQLPLQKVNLHGKTKIFISAEWLHGSRLVETTANQLTVKIKKGTFWIKSLEHCN